MMINDVDVNDRCDSELKARLLQLCWRCASEACMIATIL